MTREEALKAIRGFMGQLTEGCQEALISAIPELAESEDERMLRTIIRGFENWKSNGNVTFNNTKVDDILAYLEKQKEKSEIPVMGGDTDTYFDDLRMTTKPLTSREWFNEGIKYAQRLQKEQKPIKVLYTPKFRTGDRVSSSKNPRLTYQILGVGSVNELGNPEYEVEIFTDGKPEEPRNLKHIEIEKMDGWGVLVEQKPAEWSKNDTVFLNEIIDYFENKTVRLQHDIDMYAHWLKSLTERFNPQPKQEWSEKDEAELNDILTFIKNDIPISGDTRREFYYFLKSLRLQPKVEWSEEDKKTMQDLIDLLWIMQGSTNLIHGTASKYTDWLKSLRPQSKNETYKEKDKAFKLGKHQLAIKFMNYLDENRPEGKMGLSNSECEDIDKAFKENDWEKIIRYANKYSWKPSEEQMSALADTLEDMPEHYKPKCTLESLERDLKKLM